MFPLIEREEMVVVESVVVPITVRLPVDVALPLASTIKLEVVAQAVLAVFQ